MSPARRPSGDVVVAAGCDVEEVRRRRGLLDAGGRAINIEAMKSGKLPKVTWEKIIEHIDHAVKVAGVDHVGLGSDFDGATMPLGMEDASKLPKITEALLEERLLGAGRREDPRRQHPAGDGSRSRTGKALRETKP